VRCFVPSLSLAAFLIPAAAFAGELTSGNEDPRIWGGQNVTTCGWPTTVHVANGGSWCTGTLVHPRVVVYAAHCGASNTTIRFGENVNTARTVNEQFCQINPGWSGAAGDQGRDWAFCVLAEDVPLPITPIAYGCESQQLFDGMPVALVGFGNNSGSSGSGTKRWGMATMYGLNWSTNEVNSGGDGGPTVCSGDSGGPMFAQLADGAWRAVGIASTKNSGTCDSAGGTHSLMAGAVPWIESASGVDITPCHDVNGNWDPGPSCTGFLTSGAAGSGTYNSWCSGTGASGWSATCGPGFGNESESNPPTVSIADPYDGQFFPEVEVTVPILVDAVDDSGFIENVQLEINGMLIPDLDEEEPWQFSNVTFPTGTWELRAHAMDFWGNVGSSSAITIYVGDMPPESTTTGGGEETGGGETGGSGTGTGGEGGGSDGGGETGWVPATGGGVLDAGDDGGSGCACNAARGGRGGAAAVFGFGLLFAFRRRRP
jgi:MYXO-CTERM domain-containing protein